MICWKSVCFLRYDSVKSNSLCEEKKNIQHLYLLSLYYLLRNWYELTRGRLIWTYQRKILELYPYYLVHAKEIDKKKLFRYWKNIKTIPVPKAKTRFLEFVLDLIDSYKEDGLKNFHERWRSYKKIWKFCYPEFNYIDKYQSLIDDSRNILNLLNVENFLKLRENGTNIHIYIHIYTYIKGEKKRNCKTDPLKWLGRKINSSYIKCKI